MIPVDPSQVEDLNAYLETVKGTRLNLDPRTKADLLKADVKERNGEAFLIFRYQLVM